MKGTIKELIRKRVYERMKNDLPEYKELWKKKKKKQITIGIV